jgi:hypothetical protein
MLLPRLQILLLIKDNTCHPLKSLQNDIAKAREETYARILKWRELQATFMSAIHPMVLSQPSCAVEDEVLFLPSYFSETDRTNLGLLELAEDETKLREGQAVSAILGLRFLVKSITVLQDKRKAGDTGQLLNTRSRSRIHTVEGIRDRLLSIYNTSRNALVGLDRQSFSDRFPNLTLDDLERHSTMKKRQLNDTLRQDGAIWGIQTGSAFSGGHRGKYLLVYVYFIILMYILKATSMIRTWPGVCGRPRVAAELHPRHRCSH